MRSGGKEMGQKIKHERQLNLKREVHVRMLEGGGGKRLGLGVFFSPLLCWLPCGYRKDYHMICVHRKIQSRALFTFV